MKATLTRWAGWFTDARRQAAQALVASLVSLLVVIGAVTDAQSSALLDLSASGLLALQGALGLFLLRPGDRFTWLNTNGRGAIYSLGAAIGAAGFTFSLFSAETSSLIVQVATVVASILVGALQMVNAGTLAPPSAPADTVSAARASADAATASADAADAASSLEASPATFARERDPEWVPPLSALQVAVFWPGLPSVDRSSVGEAARRLVGDKLGSGSSIRILTSATEFRGLSVDVVLVTVPLTRALVEVFEPNVHGSIYGGDRVQHLEVS